MPLQPRPSYLSLRFLVDDISGAAIVGSRLNNVLSALVDGRSVLALNKKFLRDRGAHALVDLIDGAISEADYAACARVDRKKRLEAVRRREVEATDARRREAALAAERDKAEAERQQAARIRYESSPEFIAKQKTKALLHKYGVVDYVEAADFRRLMPILRKLDSADHLEKEDVIWIKARGHSYDFSRVLSAYHRREADIYLDEFKRSGDLWCAINASGHLRKCNASKEAIELLAGIPAQRLKHKKLKSAMLTTQGGALRDLERFPEAQQAGEDAHALSSQDYRPCTLLGAVHIQQGDYEQGHDWYRKAEERGAPPAGNDSEIRSLLRGMSEEKRQTAVAELLRIDPVRYKWLKDWLKKQRPSASRTSRPQAHGST